MNILSVHLVVSGESPDSLTIYGAYLNPDAAADELPGIQKVSGQPARILSLALGDKSIQPILDNLEAATDHLNQMSNEHEALRGSRFRAALERLERRRSQLATHIFALTERIPDEQRTEQ